MLHHEIDGHNVWMSDEAHFHQSGCNSIQNSRYWSLEIPQERTSSAPLTQADDNSLGRNIFNGDHWF